MLLRTSVSPLLVKTFVVVILIPIVRDFTDLVHLTARVRFVDRYMGRRIRDTFRLGCTVEILANL